MRRGWHSHVESHVWVASGVYWFSLVPTRWPCSAIHHWMGYHWPFWAIEDVLKFPRVILLFPEGSRFQFYEVFNSHERVLQIPSAATVKLREFPLWAMCACAKLPVRPILSQHYPVGLSETVQRIGSEQTAHELKNRGVSACCHCGAICPIHALSHASSNPMFPHPHFLESEGFLLLLHKIGKLHVAL